VPKDEAWTSDGPNICITTDDGGAYIGSMSSPELARQVCSDHNAMLAVRNSAKALKDDSGLGGFIGPNTMFSSPPARTSLPGFRAAGRGMRDSGEGARTRAGPPRQARDEAAARQGTAEFSPGGALSRLRGDRS
jgi:hypothetical protein